VGSEESGVFGFSYLSRNKFSGLPTHTPLDLQPPPYLERSTWLSPPVSYDPLCSCASHVTRDLDRLPSHGMAQDQFVIPSGVGPPKNLRHTRLFGVCRGVGVQTVFVGRFFSDWESGFPLLVSPLPRRPSLEGRRLIPVGLHCFPVGSPCFQPARWVSRPVRRAGSPNSDRRGSRC